MSKLILISFSIFLMLADLGFAKEPSFLSPEKSLCTVTQAIFQLTSKLLDSYGNTDLAFVTNSKQLPFSRVQEVSAKECFQAAADQALKTQNHLYYFIANHNNIDLYVNYQGAQYFDDNTTALDNLDNLSRDLRLSKDGDPQVLKDKKYIYKIDDDFYSVACSIAHKGYKGEAFESRKEHLSQPNRLFLGIMNTWVPHEALNNDEDLKGFLKPRLYTYLSNSNKRVMQGKEFHVVGRVYDLQGVLESFTIELPPATSIETSKSNGLLLPTDTVQLQPNPINRDNEPAAADY